MHGYLLYFQLFGMVWTVARQPPLSMGFSRKEYWSGLLCPLQSPPRDWTPVSYLLLHWQAGSLPLAPAEKPKSTILQFKKCFVIAKTGFFFSFFFSFVFAKTGYDKWKFVWGKKEFDPQKTWVRGLLGGSDMPEQGGAIGGCTRLSEKLAEPIVWEQVWD